MVSAFAARQRIVLGQVKVAEKSNEIVAIPALLDMMAIEGAVVTIDAMGCQRDIADENHREEGRLHSRAEGQSGNPARGCRGLRRRTESHEIQGHDDQPPRNSRRRSRPYRDAKLHRDPRCRLAAGAPPMAGPEGRRGGRKPARNQRQDHQRDALLHHLAGAACQPLGPMIRAHWAIENSLHWVMDMVFRDDECRVRTDNAPANFATCRHIAYNLTRKAPGKDSSASAAKPPAGTTNISPASSPRDFLHPIPL